MMILWMNHCISRNMQFGAKVTMTCAVVTLEYTYTGNSVNVYIYTCITMFRDNCRKDRTYKLLKSLMIKFDSKKNEELL